MFWIPSTIIIVTSSSTQGSTQGEAVLQVPVYYSIDAASEWRDLNAEYMTGPVF